MRILFTGGGTGGHIFPIIAVKKGIIDLLKSFIEITKKSPPEFLNVEFQFIGGSKEGKKILENEGIRVKEIISPKWRRYFSFKNFTDILKAPIAFLQAAVYVWQFMPDVIFSKGGPGSLWVVIVGWLYRIPIISHESDSFPGKTNKIAFFFSSKIVLSFEETKKFLPKNKINKIVVTGNPIRPSILLGSIERAKEIFNLSGRRKVILIMGGSQGAQQINLVFIDIIFKYIEKYEIIHISGERNFKEINLLTRGLLTKDQKKFYHLYPFLEEEKLKHAYAITSLIISRAGSGSIFEIAAVKKPSIIIPLSGAAGNHQSLNAKIFANSGCAVVIENLNITPNLVYSNAEQIIKNKKKSQEMTEACKKFAKLDAAEKIAELIIKEA